jgi:peptidoglycan/xylan/chitin deacetylase (PgdA/CDA1 family)
MDRRSSGLIWPSAHRAALCLTFDVDGPYGERNYRDPSDTYWISQTAYEPAGIDRALRILADFDITATWCWVGQQAVDRPDLIQRASNEGHEIALHTWNHRYLHQLTDEEQREDFLRTREAIERLTGVTPIGHKTAGWRYNEATHMIAQEIGVDWIMDIPSGDQPSFVQPDPTRPPLVNLAPSWLWDDYTWYVDRIASPNQVANAWQDDLDQLREEGGLMSLTLHPFVSGRPGPMRGIARFLDYAISLGDIWIAPANQIARWWRKRATDDTVAIEQ